LITFFGSEWLWGGFLKAFRLGIVSLIWISSRVPAPAEYCKKFQTAAKLEHLPFIKKSTGGAFAYCIFLTPFSL